MGGGVGLTIGFIFGSYSILREALTFLYASGNMTTGRSWYVSAPDGWGKENMSENTVDWFESIDLCTLNP